jgi:signal transduction histidine kinase/ActR/RegA family two-component response regulator
MVITDEAGRSERMVGINYDITDRKSMEEQLWTFAQELDTRVTARTQELVESQKRLRALATELNLAEQRERKRIAGELHDHLQQMLVLGKLKLGQGKRLAKPIPACAKLVEETDAVLSDALQYTRTLVAELSPPILRDQGLAAGLLWLREYMKKHDLVVTVTLPDKPNWNIPQNDAVLLFQSTRELLINASKYAGTDHAWVTVKENDGTLQIEVLDEGAGFDPAAQQEPTDGGSSQFGLFSIRERMAAMGGAFKIQSSPGKGTKATLQLSLQAMEHIAEAAPAGPVKEPHELEKSRPRLVRVLLVDDHAMVRQGLRTVLEGYADIEIAGEAANGQDAVMMVDKLQPDVVVMDVNMPGISGIEATATVKHHYPHVGIVGISINTDEEVQLEMKRAGGSALISKEAAVDDLYGAIHQALVA